MAFGMCKARVDYLKMATLSAGQTQSVLCQDAASSAPNLNVVVYVGICTAVSAMTMQMATCVSMYMQFRCKSMLPLRSQAKQRQYTIQHQLQLHLLQKKKTHWQVNTMIHCGI